MIINRFFLVLLIFLTHINLKAQFNSLGLSFGFAHNELIRNDNLDGGASYVGKGNLTYGFFYQRKFNENLALETGLGYENNTIKVIPEYFPDILLPTYEIKIKIINIPVFVKYTFFRYFFINAGTMLDFEINRDKYQNTDDQSGIGFGGGIGGQYTFHNFTLSINPFLKYHAVIPFHKEQHQQHLTETGFKFGIGYNF